MMNIIKYNRPKKEGGSGGNTFINNSTTTSSQQFKLETHSIFGQPYNGTQDVGGDISNVRNITTIGGDINVKATSDDVDKVGGNINADGTVTASKFIGDIDAKKADILNAIIQSLSGDQINYLVGFIKQLDGVKLNFNEGIIKDLLAGNISVETLTVTKAAHFFSLIIDEIKSVGGQIILTPANAKVDKVIPLNNAYKCLWKATDGNKNIYNQFAKDDQVVCQTFNLGQSNTNVSNTYYWRLCLEVGTETIDGVLYNYIILAEKDKDTDSISFPTVGDNIVQLGNRTDVTRQNAIILSAYNSKFLDAELVAPSIVQYAGINDYQLKTHRKNVISTTFNEFVGNFKVSTGETIEDYINKNIPEITNGKDGEFYRLKPVMESAVVNSEDTLGLYLKYKIEHIKGSTITNIKAGDYYVRFHSDTNSTNINLTGKIYPFYINGSFKAKYSKQSSKEAYFIVELVKDNVVLDSRIVSVLLQPAATFEIKQKTDTELASITSRVADNETNTKNGITTLTNKYSTIEQKANGIESRVGKIESSTQNIINDKQFFIVSDNQPHQSREYDVTTDTYTFKSTDKTNDIDYGSEYIKLDAGKYILSFIPTLNGEDVRMQLKILLFAQAGYSGDKIEYDVIDYSDIPQHKLYTYEFTITDEKPYLWIYLESGAQQNQKTLPWIVKLHNTKLLRFSEAESLIKQTSDEIYLKADKAGLKLKDNKIEAQANKFSIINDKNETTFEIDKNGNLIGKGSAKFKGCISFEKTIINKKNFSYYIMQGSYGGLRIDRLMTRIQFGNNELPKSDSENSYLPQQSIAMPQMFTDTTDGEAILSGMKLNLQKSEWNEICRGFAGNYFYIYNKINPKYLASTITLYGRINGVKQLYTPIPIRTGEFIVLKCELGVNTTNQYEDLIWTFINKGNISI